MQLNHIYIGVDFIFEAFYPLLFLNFIFIVKSIIGVPEFILIPWLSDENENNSGILSGIVLILYIY